MSCKKMKISEKLIEHFSFNISRVRSRLDKLSHPSIHPPPIWVVFPRWLSNPDLQFFGFVRHWNFHFSCLCYKFVIWFLYSQLHPIIFYSYPLLLPSTDPLILILDSVKRLLRLLGTTFGVGRQRHLKWKPELH